MACNETNHKEYFMQSLLKDITIEEIGQLIQSLNDSDTAELVDVFLDDESKEKLKKHLV